MSTPGSVDDILNEGTAGYGDDSVSAGGGVAMEFQPTTATSSSGTTISEKFFGIGEKKQPGPNDKIIKRKNIAQAGEALAAGATAATKTSKSQNSTQMIVNGILAGLPMSVRGNLTKKTTTATKKRPAPSEPLPGEPAAKRQKTDAAVAEQLQQQQQQQSKQPKVDVKIEDVPEDIDSSSGSDDDEDDSDLAGMDTVMEKPPSPPSNTINNAEMKQMNETLERTYKDMKAMMDDFTKRINELDSTVTKQANDLMQLQSENAELRKSMESPHKQPALEKILKVLNEKVTQAMGISPYSSKIMQDDLTTVLSTAITPAAKGKKEPALITALNAAVLDVVKNYTDTSDFVEILVKYITPIITELMTSQGGGSNDDDDGDSNGQEEEEEQDEEGEDEDEAEDNNEAPSPPPAPKKSSASATGGKKQKTVAASPVVDDGSDIFN